jgi:hypothetical protein
MDSPYGCPCDLERLPPTQKCPRQCQRPASDRRHHGCDATEPGNPGRETPHRVQARQARQQGVSATAPSPSSSDSRPAPPEVDFADYAAALEAERASADFAEDQRYWRALGSCPVVR